MKSAEIVVADRETVFSQPTGALLKLLTSVIKTGNLNFLDSRSGLITRFGDGTGPEIVIGVTTAGINQIAANPDLGLGEAYMDGSLDIIHGDLCKFFELIFSNEAVVKLSRANFGKLTARLKRRMRQMNRRNASKRNVEHHYDLSNNLYRQFLDSDLQYSCAYFSSPEFTLEEAQFAKKQHIIGKLLIEPGHHVLDIGCGWGGMALEIAKCQNVSVTGVTLSAEQLKVASDRAFGRQVNFALTDYRDVKGPFDRIVSVGMFEHVGVPNYDEFFATIARLLHDDGVALIHSIGRKDGPDITSDWIEKYIFPGGYIPALSEVLPSIERAGLWITDIEILRLHYAETLMHWRARFAQNRGEIREVYDERFCRMWEYYLAISENAFRMQGHMNFQIQLAKNVGTVPLTRDYISDHDRRALRIGSGPLNRQSC